MSYNLINIEEPIWISVMTVYIQYSFSNVNGIAAVYDYSELRMSPEAFVILWKM